MGLRSFFSSSGDYLLANELRYYSQSIPDDRAVPYGHLDQYIGASVGMDFFRGKTVLDVGCGEGVYTAWIADRGGATKAVGLDITDHRFRRQYERMFQNLEFRVGEIFTADMREAFDVVFFNLVLHHLRWELVRALAKARLMLKPGGRMLAFEPNPYSPLGWFGFMTHGSNLSANEGPLSSARASRDATLAGFRDVEIGYLWRGRRWAQHPLIASSFWMTAVK